MEELFDHHTYWAQCAADYALEIPQAFSLLDSPANRTKNIFPGLDGNETQFPTLIRANDSTLSALDSVSLPIDIQTSSLPKQKAKRLTKQALTPKILSFFQKSNNKWAGAWVIFHEDSYRTAPVKRGAGTSVSLNKTCYRGSLYFKVSVRSISTYRRIRGILRLPC